MFLPVFPLEAPPLKIRIAVGKKVPIPGIAYSSVEGRAEFEVDVPVSETDAAVGHCKSLFAIAEAAVNEQLRGSLRSAGAHDEE